MTAIAIVGMGCRFAGARDLRAYWNMTLEGRHAFAPPPADRWDADLFFSTSRREADKTYAPNGAFIDDVRSFPAITLGIPPRRVEVMDPQQRFSLEVCLEAIEDAGTSPSELPTRTGVFFGVTATEYREFVVLRSLVPLLASGAFGETPENPDAILAAASRIAPGRPYSAPGVLGNMVAAMVAQELDLGGPAYTVDSACASGLVAVNDAMCQLRVGSLDAALVGGVYLCLAPDHYIAFSRIGAMSQQGICRPFDSRADGFVQGDGAGALLLKRLEDAERDGDRIYAVIHGIGMNSDGRGDGPMAPSREGQADVIRRAWEDANLDPATAGYIETHGTATPVGDPTEILGLCESIGARVTRAALGSSKANVGHTMSAAGIAGLVRTALALYHETIPPLANFETERDDLALEETPFFIPTEPEPWTGDARCAGVSSFGFGGTNTHAVLSAAPAKPIETREQAELILMSAADRDALIDLAKRTAEAISTDPKASVAGVARALASHRKLGARLGFAAQSREELITTLRAVASGDMPEGVHIGTSDEPPKVAFLFPGQGAQRPGMLRDIGQRFPIVADTLTELEGALEDVLTTPLTELIYPDRAETPIEGDAARARLTQTAHCQPALLACGIALGRLLDQLGVQPTVATGHSLGEFTAAAAAQVLDAGDAIRFVAKRGLAMEALGGDCGAMAALRADVTTTEPLLVPGTVIANINHPQQVVVSGTTEGVKKVIANATAANVDAIPLEVSHGFHSPVLAGLDMSPLVADLSFKPSTIKVASAIDGTLYGDASHAADIFGRHALSPVRFVDALNVCDEAGADIYLQVASGGPLASFARGVFRGQGKPAFSLAAMKDDDGGRSLLEGLARLWSLGVDIDPRPICAEAAVASIPASVLPREVYWVVRDAGGTAPKVTIRPRAQAGDKVIPEATPEPALSTSLDESVDPTTSKVIAVVAKVSAYPVDNVKPTMTLMGALGFDSLMVADLVTGLSDHFPHVDGIPQELLVNNPTVQDVIDFVVASASGGALQFSDEGIMRAFAPRWEHRIARGVNGHGLELANLRVHVHGPDDALRETIHHAFTEARALVSLSDMGDAFEPDAAELIVMLDGPEPTGADPTAPAGQLIEALGRSAVTEREPHVVTLTRGHDPSAESLAAVVRCVDREWPGVIAKAIQLGTSVSPHMAAQCVLAELNPVNRTVDVRYDGDGRAVMRFDELTLDARDPVHAGDTVLITGGTRGIGLKLARRLQPTGAQLLLLGRSAPVEETLAFAAEYPDQVHLLQGDVTQLPTLTDALAPHLPITVIVHSAGVLADGALGTVDEAAGQRARDIKVQGWLNSVAAAGPSLRAMCGIGSWAGRFGNRHQSHYAAANAGMAALTHRTSSNVATSVIEFGPWTSSEMVQTIPEAVRATMRAEGVDFVSDEEGLDAIVEAIGADQIIVQARRHPNVERWAISERLSTETHPYLRDHAIAGTPILPLAAAADLVADAAQLEAPFEIQDLRLYRGVTVDDPVGLEIRVEGDRVQLRHADEGKLAYRATARGQATAPTIPERLSGGDAPPLSLEAFYGGITFHGPQLQGIRSIDAVGENFVRGVVATSRPSDWIPSTDRETWLIDPLALDSAMQLAASVAWARYERAGTPFGLGRYTQIRPSEDETLVAEVRFGEPEGDRFSADIVFYTVNGDLVAVAEGVLAELRAPETTVEEALELKPEWTDPSLWQPVKDMKLRLQMADAIGIGNPYFHIHEGTARDTTQVDGRQLVHFSGYNYLGLSGDARVVEDVKAAVETYGTSVSASRVASGERPFHQELERELAVCQGTDDALLFTAGHAANVSTIGHLCGPDDLILHDELIHDSILGGIKMSGSARRSFRHEDPVHLEEQLKELRKHYEKVLILVEGVYSMDGDICELPHYIALKRKYGCLLMVDEAHSFGVIGRTGQGAREYFDIDGHDVDIWMGTLSKSLASCGGWIAGRKDLIDYLRYTVGGFIFSAGMTPANAQAALSSLRLMLKEQWRVEKLQSTARFFHRRLTELGLDTGPAVGGSAVVPVVTGNSIHALFLSKKLADAGVNVQPIVFPAVADDAARLRFFLTCLHSEEQLDFAATTVAKLLDEVRTENTFRGKRV